MGKEAGKSRREAGNVASPDWRAQNAAPDTRPVRKVLCRSESAARPSLCAARPLHDGATICHSGRSEELTSELQSLMRISYAVFCLKKKIIYIYRRQDLHISSQNEASDRFNLIRT